MLESLSDSQTGVPSKLETLAAALLEVTTRRPTDFVDPARVGAFNCAEVNAGSVILRREGDHAEVAWLDRFGDVVPTHVVPANQVAWRN